MARPQAKASKKARAQAAFNDQLTADELFLDLSRQYAKATGEKKTRLGLELLPYLKPKLKSVDLTMAGELSLTIKIGGKQQ